jgi:cysteine synthase
LSTILDTIGDTPLVRLTRCAPANGAELWLKLEYRNPTGSLKDRMALAMIEGAEREGALAPGETVVEYTGGSTGPALAFVCSAKGYRCLIVIADCFTEERFQHGVFIQAHEPAGSAAISGGTAGWFAIQGWTGIVMPHWDAGRVDYIEPVEDEDSLAMTLRLSQEEGIFAGISTGANVVGAHRLAERLGPEAVIVTLAVDSGFKYMSVPPYVDL